MKIMLNNMGLTMFNTVKLVFFEVFWQILPGEEKTT